MSRLFIQVNDVEVTLQSTKEFPAGMIEAAMQLAQIGLREAITVTPTVKALTDDGRSVPSKSNVTKPKPKAIPSATPGARLSNVDMVRQLLRDKPGTLQEVDKRMREVFFVTLDSSQISSVFAQLRNQGEARRRDEDGRWEMARKAEAV